MDLVDVITSIYIYHEVHLRVGQ